MFPGSSNLNILRTLNPSFTPLPNITGFGTPGSIYAQLFYDGIEQFYCHADECTQDLGSGDGSSSWNCNDLQCTCQAHSSFCGGGSVLDLTQIINTLNGTVSVSCDAPSSNGSASCAFKQSTINSVFGNSGLTLNGCAFGECVGQNVIDTLSSSTSSNSTDTSGGGSSLSGGVIAGLAVVGGLIGLALFFLAFGWWLQRRARRTPSSFGKTGGTSIQWSYVSYFVPNASQGAMNGWFGWTGRSKNDLSDTKVVLDSVSGQVLPGHMMAILGPSGMFI